jgi:hypothetical protein
MKDGVDYHMKCNTHAGKEDATNVGIFTLVTPEPKHPVPIPGIYLQTAPHLQVFRINFNGTGFSI